MKFIAQLILIAIFTYLVQLFLPWWGLFITAGIVGALITSNGFSTFMAGFIAVGGLWFWQIYLSKFSIIVRKGSLLEKQLVWGI